MYIHCREKFRVVFYTCAGYVQCNENFILIASENRDNLLDCTVDVS